MCYDTRIFQPIELVSPVPGGLTRYVTYADHEQERQFE